MKYKCNQCRVYKEDSEFYYIYVSKRKKTYRQGHCRLCQNERNRKNYIKHREKILTQKKEKYKKDPWSIKLRRLKDRCNKGYISIRDLKKLYESSEGKCYYCGKKFSKNFKFSSEKFTFDHAIPISKGGTNDVKNLRVCCLHCNSQKNNMSEQEFFLKKNGVPF